MKAQQKIFFLLSLFIISACEEVAKTSRKAVTSNSSEVSGVPSGVPGSTSGNGAVATGEGGVDNAEKVESATVEIRHLIEPKIDDESEGGAYLKKLTIPKNYNGLLYIAGININTLRDKNVQVRFRFGRDKTPIEIPATIHTAAGLTPQTDVQVLILDMRNKPFETVRLLYDLYDYNEYDYTGADTTKLSEPVQSNRDSHLFCRGLKLEDDPTFGGQITNGCSQANDVCKYTFAQVIDQALVVYNSSTDKEFQFPKYSQVQSGSSSYYQDSDEIRLGRCLPNEGPNSYKYSDTTTFNLGVTTTIGSNPYRYEGPYRLESQALWEISGSAITSNNGLYSTASPVVKQSYLFPLAIKQELAKDTQYLGSSGPGDSRSLQYMASTGESLWMDGCNARATTMDDITGEHIGSCNVTSKIEIFYEDSEGVERQIATKEVKLQLVKPSQINSSGDDVLLSSFKSCTSSSQCGSSQCCISGRCWSKSIVSQCVEDLPSYGNKLPGESCNSSSGLGDYECSSLCCQGGKCAVHDTNSEPEVFCSKGTGQACIAKEWCSKVPVTRCFIIKTNLDAQGGETCALRCYTFEEFLECKNGRCGGVPPVVNPTFNVNDPNRCAQACDPPDFSNGYFDFTCGGTSTN